MYSWIEKPSSVEPFLAEVWVEERIGNALYRRGDSRATEARRLLRRARPRLDGRLARHACRILRRVGDYLVALGRRLQRYGLVSTTPAGKPS